MNKKDQRLLQKINVFKDMCISVSSLSYDTKYKVGSIIFEKDNMIINSSGYNGNYRGGPNERDSMESGQSGFVHSELNCLLNSDMGKDRSKYVLMCTMSACGHCAKCIVNSGIKSVIFLTRYTKDNQFEEIFKNAGIKYLVVEDGEFDLKKLKQII